MSIEIIQIENLPENLTPDQLRVAALAVLRNQSTSEDTDLTIVIDNDAALQEMNLQYRNIDEPTDVLSFAANITDPENGHPYIGDIVISLPTAQRQALAAGHDTLAELQLLIVHGTLHLIGFDHENFKEKKKMWGVQKIILQSINAAIFRWPED